MLETLISLLVVVVIIYFLVKSGCLRLMLITFFVLIVLYLAWTYFGKNNNTEHLNEPSYGNIDRIEGHRGFNVNDLLLNDSIVRGMEFDSITEKYKGLRQQHSNGYLSAKEVEKYLLNKYPYIATSDKSCLADWSCAGLDIYEKLGNHMVRRMHWEIEGCGFDRLIWLAKEAFVVEHIKLEYKEGEESAFVEIGTSFLIEFFKL